MSRNAQPRGTSMLWFKKTISFIYSKLDKRQNLTSNFLQNIKKLLKNVNAIKEAELMLQFLH